MVNEIELNKKSADVLILFIMLIAFVAGYILGNAMGEKGLAEEYKQVVNDLNNCNAQKGWVIDNFLNNQYTKIPYSMIPEEVNKDEQERI